MSLKRLRPADYVGIPLGIAATICLIMAFIADGGVWAKALIFPFVGVALVYILSPQINWFFWKRNPPEPNEGIVKMLERLPYYQTLPSAEQERFRKRVFLFTEGNDFMRPAPPQEDNKIRNDVPPDLKALVAAANIQLTLRLPEFMATPYEHFILYPSAFPSPKYPQQFHFSETYDADGVVLFAAESLTNGMTLPQQYFNIGLYEFAKIFRKNNPQIVYPNLGKETWTELEKIGGISEKIVEQSIGLPNEADLWAATVVAYFSSRNTFIQHLPDVAQLLKNIFCQ